LPSRKTFSAIVAVMAHKWRVDVHVPVPHKPLRRIGGRAGRAIKLVLENVAHRRGTVRRRGRQWHPIRGGASGRNGKAWASGRGIAAAAAAIPVITSSCDDPSQALPTNR